VTEWQDKGRFDEGEVNFDTEFVKEEARWFRPEHPPKAVALLVHGLNLKPSRMDTLASFLSGKGITSLRMVLAGHGGSLEEMKTVTRGTWLNDLAGAYRLVRQEAKELPVYLVGFSLGALVALDAENDPALDVRFDKEVLLAPAVGVRFFTKLVRLLGAFPRLVIPSAAPTEYRANRGTTVAAYSALFTSISRLREHGFGRTTAPGLVFLDPRDELVSPASLRIVQRENPGLPWKIDTIKVQPEPGLWPRYRHLLIDPRAAGAANWERITRGIEEHLQ
jgi:alpha-beta hydrolase superfamily lysophospholipase